MEMNRREDFELTKEIVEWLMKNGCAFMEAMAICSYSIESDRKLSQSYIELKRDWLNEDRNGK